MNTNSRLSRTRTTSDESSNRRQKAELRRSGFINEFTEESATPGAREHNKDVDTDGGDDGLVLGFEHRMSTEERRRMRERDRDRRSKGKARLRSSRSSSPTGQGSLLSRSSTHSTGVPSSSFPKKSSRSSADVGIKFSARPTRESERRRDRELGRDGKITRRNQLDHRTSTSPSHYRRDRSPHQIDRHSSINQNEGDRNEERRRKDNTISSRYDYDGERRWRDDRRRRETAADTYARRKEERRTHRSRYGSTDDTIIDRAERDRRREERRRHREKERTRRTEQDLSDGQYQQQHSLSLPARLYGIQSSGTEFQTSENVEKTSFSTKLHVRDGKLDHITKVEPLNLLRRKNHLIGLDEVTPRHEEHRSADGEVSLEGEENLEVQANHESSSEHHDEEQWTVRVYLISAVDLPFNIVPNTPLCPVLKFGLVRVPAEDERENKYPPSEKDTATSSRPSRQKSTMADKIEKNGLLSVSKARVRCTSSKILSKKDNGSIEYHEEMRWDKVKKPNETALAIELCARAARPPPNISESPLKKPESSLADSSAILTSTRTSNWGTSDDYEDVFQRSTDTIAGSYSGNSIDSISGISVSSNSSGPNNTLSKQVPGEEIDEIVEVDDDSSQPSTGIAGMRALWKKSRQQFEQRQAAKRKGPVEEMESATAAAAVARFLVGGKEEGGDNLPDSMETTLVTDDSENQDVFRTSSSFGTELVLKTTDVTNTFGKHASAQGRHMRSGDENVALMRPKKKRKPEMAEDVRLGSLVIPLTRLPLEKATGGEEAARIEQWYQLDTSNNSLSLQPNTRRGLSTGSKLGSKRNPSVLLEISFSSAALLDESEDEVEMDSDPEKPTVAGGNLDETETGAADIGNKSFSRRASIDIMKQKATAAAHKADASVGEKKKIDEDPVLEPGVCDYIAVVGASNIGDQTDDDGGKGWVKSDPDCSILERFPPSDQFHTANNRNASLDDAAIFCFPEGCRLWRGVEPPSHYDLNLKRFSASSPPNVASSIAAFDACLNCTTSFSWFVMQSNEKENDFKNVKTYGAVIKFYAPAPTGIDSTQDDFVKGIISRRDPHQGNLITGQMKRLWVPLGILMTSRIPIIGTMEAMLLRLCEALASHTGGSEISLSHRRIKQTISHDLANLIVNFQKPIPGVLHCSIPFLTGERLHLTVPPSTGLPALPHGSSVTSVCRLLGSEGLTLLLAAVLTESKIVIHSDEVANLAMVAEVATTLMYPFVWSLPYLPVLPEKLLDMVEAPLSYIIGVLSCNMELIDEQVFAEIVVIDLDNGFSSPDYYEGRRNGRLSKTPVPLPASVASNISKAVFRLLREEEEVEEEYGTNNMHGSRSLPRLEGESLAEREFRIAVALQICGLVRGYDECLYKVSASQPVFNRDKFLRTAPALFEERRGNLSSSVVSGGQPQKMLSPRSKRFLSVLTHCQHFHQFLEMLDQDECMFFNEVMYAFEKSEENIDKDNGNSLGYGSGKLEESACHLIKVLQKVEDKIPTYRVDRKDRKKKKRSDASRRDEKDDDDNLEDLLEAYEGDNDMGFSDDGNLISSFTGDLLQQLILDTTSIQGRGSPEDEFRESEISQDQHKGALSVQYLNEFEKGNHWHYNKLFDIPLDADPPVVEVREKVKLRDAIGDRRYRAWKMLQEQKNVEKENNSKIFTGDKTNAEENTTLDLSSLVSQVPDETDSMDSTSVGSLTSFSKFNCKIYPSSLSPEQRRVQDAKDRDILRRCLQRAYEGSSQRRPTRYCKKGSGNAIQQNINPFYENGRDLIADAEAALRNPSSQKFLVSVLSQRARLESQRKRRPVADDRTRRGCNQQTVSRLEVPAFDCLVRLCLAMLDACLENKDYESGYKLLIHTQGFCTIHSKDAEGIKNKDTADDSSNIVYMTARISLHPIFAELELWEGVLHMKLVERAKDRKEDDIDSKEELKDADEIDYDTTVSILYEMHALGVPSEELARFAAYVSEKKGWLVTERGQSLPLQAKRLSAKRENVTEAACNAGDLDMMRSSVIHRGGKEVFTNSFVDEERLKWKTIGWCHPAATVSSRSQPQISSESEINSTARVGQNLLSMIGKEEKKAENESNKYLKRSPVTTLAAFGSSVVASGGLDGSVFVAHSISFAEDTREKEDCVYGVCLDWGSSGSRTAVVGSGSSSMDGEYGVGAVSCLAAAKGAGYRNSTLAGNGTSFNKDVSCKPDEDDILQTMEGCRVVAGTTGGDLRVWSMKEVYAATAMAKKGEPSDISKPISQLRISRVEEVGLTSSFLSRNNRGSITEIAAGSAFSRLKVSLRGRALSGHRGGVTCVDVPSHIYRPDALVTGGADGFIKLWSLRNPTGRRGNELIANSSSSLFNSPNITSSNGNETLSQSRTKGSRGGDALSILSGHTGRVLCVKTAWHGDRLLSGGADCTVRVWDLSSSSNGKCLHELRGHLGWVTQSHYWGPNTVVSASSDRAIALWDARVRRSPLFILRYHKSPISDLLVGARTDPLMVSAAADGTVATWDFRTLSGKNSSVGSTRPVNSTENKAEKKCRAIRTPSATIMHCAEGRGVKQSGEVLLSRCPSQQRRSFLSIGVDAVIREWDMITGLPIGHESTHHSDAVSSFYTFLENSYGASVEDDLSGLGGTLTSSWDGTIRMRKLVKK